MRVINETALTKDIKCTLFSWNGKYIIKLEKGNLEQTYKISEMDISGLKAVETLLTDPIFLNNIISVSMLMDKGLDPVY